ncbi:family 5 glycoside hydrolase [Melampsora larici-populina 98AG31]|uniref:mannan endo-1,4-beta-mannosidase n=1 Tax=Melampsora larici-populina (strain 98AG31 / pathotype 3-4-7) TaxID=747676 RepID=F4RW98_MELLP|nr:family 5 glycoside hydrolase [Melampsora larici-populina 98AG31]EGG03246.1 family 5 glycoside hydrolase [Melampsora larici-populina 98AG31]
MARKASYTTLALFIVTFNITSLKKVRSDSNHVKFDALDPLLHPPMPSPSPTTPWAVSEIAATPLPRYSSSQSEDDDLDPVWQPLPTSAPSLLQHEQCNAQEKSKKGGKKGKPQKKKCVGRYHHSLATTVSGAAGTLGTPKSFIKRHGTILKAGPQFYRPVGPNIYWLGLDENDGRKVSYPSKKRIREAFAIAAAMGANTVRSITLGVSTGNPLSIWPSKGETNEDAFDPIDYAIGTARHYGIRHEALPDHLHTSEKLTSPLHLIYHAYLRFYHGGKYDFLEWEGINSADRDAEQHFYTNRKVIDSFKAYIKVILNHVNQYTGIALKDDPTIMAWETGNELGAFNLKEGAAPGDWTTEIANHIKRIDTKHLVVDGSDGIRDTDGDEIDGLSIDPIDIVTDHMYHHTLSMSSDKVLVIGEYDWTGSNGGMPLSTFYNQLRKAHNVGDFAWNVMSHDDQCCRFIAHDDGYSIYYPNGNANLLQRRLLRLVQHCMTGRESPHVLPAVACPQPEWYSDSDDDETDS